MKLINIQLILIFVLLFVLQASAQSLLENGKIPKDLVIRLERTICFGTCPDYTVTINANGKVTFKGGQFTKVKGSRAGKITRTNLKRLITEFEKAKFFSFPDDIEKSGLCEQYVTDLPSEIISIQINGKDKRVNHYFGCVGEKAQKELAPLIKLGKKIDEITRSKRWTGK